MVDRFVNVRKAHASLSARRAWIEMVVIVMVSVAGVSLSARRAWIEIDCPNATKPISGSLSARRAWIEMPIVAVGVNHVPVALRKESVDRNKPPPFCWGGIMCRSPQGERG